MKDLEKLKEMSLQDLGKLLKDHEAEILLANIGWSRTNELSKDIKKIRRLISQREEILD